jgi:cell migration-inducing and hyaluronan-binding protein
MHGNKQMKGLPIYGNKVLAVRHGVLEMHGVKRTPTWTKLAQQATISSKKITLVEAVDWKIGETIVIAPTGFASQKYDERTIIDIDNSNPDKPILTLDREPDFPHYADLE